MTMTSEGALIMFQLDKGKEEGGALWDRWMRREEGIEVPGGYPELCFYEWRDGASHRALRVAPRCGAGKFSDPLTAHGWQVIESAPALPCGWAPSAEFTGPLADCLFYAINNYALDLDCPTVKFVGLDREVIKDLAFLRQEKECAQ